MKIKRLTYLTAFFLSLVVCGCEKDTEAEHFAPEVITGKATSIYRKGATLEGSILITPSSSADRYGILFSRMKSMAESTEYPITDGSTEYALLVQNLEPNRTYYYCSYAHSGYSQVRGEIKSFKTTETNVPMFNDIEAENISPDRITLTTTFLDEGGSPLIISGFCWREGSTGMPTLIDHVVNVSEAENGRITAEITGLQPNTDYVVSAYSVNSAGMGFSKSLHVRTTSGTVPGGE